MKFRVKFARKILDKNFADFWEEGVGSVWMGQGFLIKGIFLQTWRNSGQGFDSSFTGKCSHDGTGENVTYFMAAIAYGKGGIAGKHYHGRINAENISSSICERFSQHL